MLTCLAVVALWRSALPAAFAGAGSLAVVLLGAMQWRREGRRPRRQLLIPPGCEGVRVDGRPVTNLRVQWIGPLASLSWRGTDRRTGRCLFWPDTLGALPRRELRLAASSANISRRRQGMAP